MTIFAQSTKAASAAVQEIADTVGASGDAEMLNRSYRSLCAALEHTNARANWEFTLVEAPPLVVVAPFAVTGVTASAGQTSAQAPAGHGIEIDDIFSAGTFFMAGTRVLTTAASSFSFNTSGDATLGTNSVVTGNFTRDMYPLPSDYRQMYSIRMFGQQSALRPLRRRLYDRSIINEFVPTTPVGYDVSRVFERSKIRFLPPPGYANAANLRYYSRVYIPSATADSTLLDIPQDYEPYVIAWGKWHFLTDKGDGRSEQAATWLQFADGGFKSMLSDQTRLPDEDLMFTPGFYSYNPAWGPNSVRGNLDDFTW